MPAVADVQPLSARAQNIEKGIQFLGRVVIMGRDANCATPQAGDDALLCQALVNALWIG